MKNRLLVLGVFILGVMLSMFVKSFNPLELMTVDKVEGLRDEINAKNGEIRQLETTLNSYKKELGIYETASEEENIKDAMEKELEKLKSSSGRADVEGRGVMVTMSDSERELKKDEDPNDLLIHDIDILRVINDLKKAGATAISINSERVIENSKIECSGSTITVNDTTYGEPFVIRALGDVDALSSAVDSPDSYSYLLKTVYGIDIDMEKKANIKIKKLE
ncbi:MAG: DUF881 domain-containing protein [Clostridioides sp.]|nr:DUF881 domain-containing protein [Clostridioides sp.]